MRKKDYTFQVLEAISQQSMPTGALYLSELLQVPPAKIGRTLLELENDGYLEKVQNKGRVITGKGKEYLQQKQIQNGKLAVANELIAQSGSVNRQNLVEILQTRRILESYTASVCAKKITEEQKRELENLHLDYIYELRHGNSGSEGDFRLHMKIAEIAGNQVICRILKLILSEGDSYSAFTNAAIRAKGLEPNAHSPLIDAIIRGDGEAASMEMDSHLAQVLENVQTAD